MVLPLDAVAAGRLAVALILGRHDIAQDVGGQFSARIKAA